jgi:hypothetical protein
MQGRLKRRTRLLGVVCVLAAVTVIAAACSSNGSSTPNNTNSSTTTTNPAAAAMVGIGEHDILPAAATGQPVVGGTLKIMGSGDVDHLDTCCAYYTTTYELLRAVSRQLVSYPSTHANPTPTQPVPDIATYSISSFTPSTSSRESCGTSRPARSR